MNVLANKITIVTGASSGIGYATAKLFAQEGAKVVVSARRQIELDALVAQIEDAGGQAVAVAGDVKDESLAKALVDTAVGRFGGLDIAFNNAGAIGEMGPVSDVSLAGWRDTLDTNLTSAFLGAKYQAPAMIERGGGSLIFTSSFVGYTVGMPGMAAYAASKAGLIGLAKVLAAEFGAKGVRANAILPGAPIRRRASPTPQGPHRRYWLSLKACTPSSAWRSPTRSRDRCFISHRTRRASSGTAFLVDGGVSINRT